MALIVETGEGSNPAANTYATVAQLRSFSAARGATLPAADADCEVLLLRAMDYVEAQESRYQGERMRFDQPLAWPRTGVIVYGRGLASNVIPAPLLNAQMALAIQAQTADLMPAQLPGERGAVTRYAVGSLEMEYADPVSQTTTPRFPAVEAFLAPLMAGAGYGTIRLVRA